MTHRFLLFLLCLGVGGQQARAEDVPARSIKANGNFDLLPTTSARVALLAAGAFLGPDRLVEVSIAKISMNDLLELGNTPAGEPIERAAREHFSVPLDLNDFLLFLDDVLVQNPYTTGRVVLTPHVARKVGVLIHPDEVFPKKRKRRRRAKRRWHHYKDQDIIYIDPPTEEHWKPAADGAPLGPAWHGRFPNPSTEDEHFRALQNAHPESAFSRNAKLLLDQLRAQGATAFVDSSFRYRERGYLMFGAFTLDEATTEAEVEARIVDLEKLATEYGLNVPIAWRHPDGWKATKAAAALMRDAYRVVYATRKGALNSNHYDGNAIDLTAIGLPRSLILNAPDGTQKTFDLSAASQTRDLSLTPELITFVQEHFGLMKNFWDYPHWNDVEATKK